MLKIARTTLLIATVAAALSMPAATADAQNLCVPQASGVPYLSGPPNWFTVGPEPQYWPEVDDPRWRGAFLRTFGGAAASEHVAFRALRIATHLYFQWNITVDPQLDEIDELWVAFSPGPGQDDVLIQITPFSNSGTNVLPPTTAAAVQVLTRTPGAAFAPLGALPMWLVPGSTDLRVLRVVESGIQGRWAVMMRVPILAPPNGINVANSFKMWSGTMVTHPAGIAEYDYPEGIDLTNVLASTNNTGWQDVRRDVAPSDASCIRGVSITSSDIGTESNGTQCTAAGALSSSINLTLPGVGAGTTILGLTTMCARPLNETGGNIAANDLEATFRIANWGTQPTDPMAISAAWTRINPTPARNSVAIGNGFKGALEFDWQMTANDGSVNDVCTFTPQPTVTGVACNALPATPRQRHQCMLVELGGAPGITFPVSSVARNMNFVSASTFEREAEVSLRGVPAGPGAPPQRDVYLFVQTNNLPAQVNGQTRPPERRKFTVTLPPRNDSVVGEGSGEVEPLPKTPFEQLRETQPTYQVHGFRDTGRTVTRGGRTYKLLAPQSSFGYFVEHSGALLGWRHELQGAVEIADDYYLVAVNQGGTAKVTTLIEAIDSRWSASIHGGLNVPVGDFGDSCDPGFSMGLDAEYRFTGMFAAEVFYGLDRFGCGEDTATLNHFSVNGKMYFGQVKYKPFVGGGIGRYDVSNGGSDTGTNLFGGLQVNLTSTFAVEGTAKFHFLELSGVENNFFTIHGGVRIRF